MFGNSGRSDGAKIINIIVNRIISPEFMININWTGKPGKTSSGHGPKIKFQMYTNIVQLITKVVMAADKSVTEEKAIDLIIYKAIKYAYSRSKTPSSINISPSSTEILVEVASTCTPELSSRSPSPSMSPSRVATSVQFCNSTSNVVQMEQNHLQQNAFGNGIEQRPMFASQPPPIYPPQHMPLQQQPIYQQMHPHAHPYYQPSYSNLYGNIQPGETAPLYTNL